MMCLSFRSLFASLLLGLLAAIPAQTFGAAFSVQPASSTNKVGDLLVLKLVQDSSPTTQQPWYQWFKGGAPLVDNARVSGAQSPELQVGELGFADAGTYVVAFTNGIGTNASRLFATGTVFVVSMPAIVGELQSRTTGSDVTFTVSATGGLLSYQWVWQGQDIPGATNSSLRFTNAYATANAGYYNVRVSNPAEPGGIMAEKSLLFVKPAPSGTYQGLFYDSEAVAAESTGFFEMRVSSGKSTFSGKLTIGTSRHSFSGKFLPDHSAETEVPRKGGSPLKLRLQLATLNDLPQVDGAVENTGAWSSRLHARLTFVPSPALPVGSYTLALQNTNTAPELPNGDSFGSFTVRRNGSIAFKGRTADGSSMSQSVGVSRSGDWPLYVSQYKGRGAVAGWLRAQKQTSGSVLGGPVAWFKGPGPDKTHPDGFELLLLPAGSTYTKPTTNSVLGFTNGVATLFGGDLLAGDAPLWTFVKVAVLPPTSLRPEKSPEDLRLSVSSGTGTISGDFKHPATGRRSEIRGVTLQQQGAVRGYFLSTNASGAFMVAPGPR